MTTNKRSSPGQEDICPSPHKRVRLAPSPSPQDCALSGYIRSPFFSPPMRRKALLVSDRDADALCSGAVVSCTLQLLRKGLEDILVHFVGKGRSERATLDAFDAEWVVVMDQGSRPGRAIVETERGTKCLIIDHHWSEAFPEDSPVVSACKYEPVATSSLLTYEICKPLHPHVKRHTDWLAAMKTYGDFGVQRNFCYHFLSSPRCTLAALVSQLNAPRKTVEFDTLKPWYTLCPPTPSSILTSPFAAKLKKDREDTNAEVERRTQPQYSLLTGQQDLHKPQLSSSVRSSSLSAAYIFAVQAIQVTRPKDATWRPICKEVQSTL